MSSFTTFGSQQISLDEQCRSSFALVVSYLCVGQDLPPPSNVTDEGCQWEMQTDKDWIPYLDSQV
jgi:hypothetical protein